MVKEKENLTKSGIFDYIKDIQPETLLQSRIICGILKKRSNGKIKYFARRWCVLISGKPLIEGMIDEKILTEDNLPP